MKKTKGRKILEFIKESNGVTYTDIVRFIIRMNQNREYDWKTDRGYYASYLNGTWQYKGLLRHCYQSSSTKKYYIDEIPEGALLESPGTSWQPYWRR